MSGPTAAAAPDRSISRFAPCREVLDNGIVLLRNETHDSPSVALRASFPAGSAREPVEKAGLASLTARLTRRGTRYHSAGEISSTIEDLGASFHVWAGAEEAGFGVKCLSRDLGTVLEVLRECLEAPVFEEGELEKTRGETLTHLRELEDSPRAQADRAILSMLYPDEHPYSHSSSGCRETVLELTRAAIREFHATYYGAPGMKVCVGGSVDPEALRAHFGRWFDRETFQPPPPMRDWRVTPSGTPGSAEIPMSHKSQVDIALAGPGIPRDHPDYLALAIVNVILGSLGLMGRLGQRIREEQGLAYHVSSRTVSRLWAGEWSATAGVAPQNVDQARESILAEVRRIREEFVDLEELDDARDYLIGSLPLRMETNDGIAAYLLNAEYYGLGLDYVHRYPGLVRAETRETLREAARRHMDPDRFSVAMAGPI